LILRSHLCKGRFHHEDREDREGFSGARALCSIRADAVSKPPSAGAGQRPGTRARPNPMFPFFLVFVSFVVNKALALPGLAKGVFTTKDTKDTKAFSGGRALLFNPR
ncbi:hypothetical protein, partial [Thioalkalivibrio sp.]|uniref:hypothetical protein n=1 Tax=Thioalkalivibrio sp. TaxID=2093813 RepID=UPI003976C39A